MQLPKHKIVVLLFSFAAFIPSYAQRPAPHLKALPVNPAETQAGSLAAPLPSRTSFAKTAAVSPVSLGTMTNLFSVILPAQNQVVAKQNLNTVGFVHRQDINVWGGPSTASGILRYDYSTDGGQSFTLDAGPVSTGTNAMRYPNAAIYNPLNNTSPVNAYFSFVASGLNGSSWDGFSGGTVPLAVPSPTATQQNVLAGSNLRVMSLCNRTREEMWAVSLIYNTSGIQQDSLALIRGDWNAVSQQMDWVVAQRLHVPFSRTYDGDARSSQPVLSFSPDGVHGWVGMTGDLAGGHDSLYSPIFIHSTDGGLTWGQAEEFDLRTVPWLSDSLQVLWVDSAGNPASTGRPTCGFECDLTVDANGEPHLFTLVGSGTATGSTVPGYSIFSGLAKYAMDISHPTASLPIRIVCPVMAFRGEFGAPDPQTGLLHTQDNYPQVSRTPDGLHLFFSWVDSDTLLTGFGESGNVAPDLRIAGFRIVDDMQTCFHDLTVNDIVWSGKVIAPTMAPEVLSFTNGQGVVNYRLPIVVTEMLMNDQNMQCKAWYFGNDAVLDETEFVYAAPAAVWATSCNGVPSAVYSIISGQIFQDLNLNGIYDANELPVPNALVRMQGVNWLNYAYTNYSGLFATQVRPDNYTVTVVSGPGYQITHPAAQQYTVNVTQSGTAYSANDFGLGVNPSVYDYSVGIYPHLARPGLLHYVYLYANNLVPTQQQPDSVVFWYDPLLTYTGTHPLELYHDAAAHKIVLSCPSLNPFQSQIYQLAFSVPVSAPLGTILNYHAHIYPDTLDADPVNNDQTMYATVVNSLDPNDKAVSPAGIGPEGYVDDAQWLTYTIRFQNTGTAEAINVEIRDSLDPDLDMSSFQMLGASHAYNLTVSGHGYLSWYFGGIMLPDSFTNEPASHGWIQYRIRPGAQAVHGDEVTNTAHIYFDYNPAVVTNTTLNTLDFALVVTPAEPGLKARIYPHPVTGTATFELLEYTGAPFSLRILDMQGRELRTLTGDAAGKVHLDREGLPAGLYLYEAVSGGTRLAGGKMVVN